ncbi:MAG: amylo-alpha-1,6-glucosidase [Pseudomonadota bacterium]
MTSPELLACEWLEADGLGGFASGTVGGIRTRRYHALLLVAIQPPSGRMVLVNGLEAWLETASGSFALTSHRYMPVVIYPDGQSRISGFESEPWPRWTFRMEDGTEICHEVVAHHGQGEVACRWRQVAGGAAKLNIRPLLSGRDYHALHHENGAFAFLPETCGDLLTWRPYQGVPPISLLSNGAYRHEPTWYRNYLYEAERERGLDFIEDLAAPGVLTWNLDQGEAVLVLEGAGRLSPGDRAGGMAAKVFGAEKRRREAMTVPQQRAAEAYVVRRGEGKTIIAGYPWFTDWGRDTFIALRGFMTLPGGLDLARQILLAWAPTVSEGMLPNRFPDGGSEPEYNAVDASLWYVIAADESIRAGGLNAPDEQLLDDTIDRIIAGYRTGTRFDVRMDDDGLIAAGVPGVQLTWMDAKVGDWVVTPRIGKPVEIQALWINALSIAARRRPELGKLCQQAMTSFQERFWSDQGFLHDVVDVDHECGRDDASLRPNQILAVGGLPLTLIESAKAAQVVETVEKQLLTPMGLRSLAPDEPAYRDHYGGGVRERDGAYHQGTVWPWLLGPFVEAWLRQRDHSPEARREASDRFLAPLRAHLEVAGLGHVSEIADGASPHTPRGCPFQAWSLAEMLRISRMIEDSTP